MNMYSMKLLCKFYVNMKINIEKHLQNDNTENYMFPWKEDQ